MLPKIKKTISSGLSKRERIGKIATGISLALILTAGASVPVVQANEVLMELRQPPPVLLQAASAMGYPGGSFASHRSHVSHTSHASHASHVSHYSSTTPTTPITAPKPPLASFTLSQSSTTAPATLDLDASGSSALSGSINLIQWSTSNGQSASGKNASFVFNTQGTYTITLTLIDSNGLTSTSVKTVTVKPAVTLLTGLTASCPTSVKAGETATCDATASWSNGGTSGKISATWTSSNTAVATMNGNTLTGGSVTTDTPVSITATYSENGVTQQAISTIMVSAPVAPKKCVNATYSMGKLTIAALDIPITFNQNSIYKVEMDYVPLSNPLEFKLTSAQIVASVSGCQNATYLPSDGIVGIPAVEVPGVGQYNVSLLVVPGTDPMHFRLRDASSK